MRAVLIEKEVIKKMNKEYHKNMSFQIPVNDASPFLPSIFCWFAKNSLDFIVVVIWLYFDEYLFGNASNFLRAIHYIIAHNS